MQFLTHIDLNKNELQNAVIQNLAAAPSNPKVGQIYYNTVDQMTYQWKKTSAEGVTPETFAWKAIGGVTAGDGLANNDDTLSVDIGNGIELTGTSPNKKVAAKAYNGITVNSNGISVKPYDGIKVDSNGVSADIDTTKGLEFIGSTAGSKKIGVKVDSTLEFNNGTLKVTVPTDNNFTTGLKEKLEDIEAGAEVNTIETVKVNGTALAPDANRAVDIPKVDANNAGVAPKGAAVSTQSQTTKFLREDGTWAAPSYTANPSGTYLPLSGGTMSGVINMSSNKITSLGTPTANTDAATKKYVDDAITNLPEPMIFKGTLGTGGTITSLPTASASNEGWTYKVITAGTYNSQVAKVGDLFICRNVSGSLYEWTYVPSGDEPSGTVTNIATGSGLTGGPITTTGTISLDTAYGDTVNPYGEKSPHYVLAGPSSGSTTAVPSFRALVAADIPDISGKYVTTNTQQSISGTKEFTGITQLHGITDIRSYFTLTYPVGNNDKQIVFEGDYNDTSNTVLTFSNGQSSNNEVILRNVADPITNQDAATKYYVDTAVSAAIGGAVYKTIYTNSALTASGGAWTWTINTTFSNGDLIISVYEVSTGAIVYPDISINSSGVITITINDTAGAGTLAAGTYKAVVLGGMPGEA